ncbi:hypothetical protein VE04_07910 [Pseudogymnoascus sp. 24MN13]|nr:hypothetical protein VE04_07910 [Pseudogymnoascus sp. 24MN13]
MAQPTYVILGGGVIGLTTALTLQKRSPSARIILGAQHLLGDLALTYASPWAGANWLSVATDGGRAEARDAVTYVKFGELADGRPEAGVRRMPIRAMFDKEREEAGVLSPDGKIWYEELVGGLREVKELPEGVKFGYELDTFVVDVTTYLPWLLTEAIKAGVEVRRKVIGDIKEVFEEFPEAEGFVNCTGIGSYSLKGVEDKELYPTMGQVILVESPKTPIEKMYFRSPQRTHSDTTYVFPRGKHGGVILGGCRLDGVWTGEVNLDLAEDIKKRCCELCPELGKPEDLKVIRHGLGLRPSRNGGARVEREAMDGRTVVHSYGAGGAGYQASWGTAKEAVDLLLQLRQSNL